MFRQKSFLLLVLNKIFLITLHELFEVEGLEAGIFATSQSSNR